MSICEISNDTIELSEEQIAHNDCVYDAMYRFLLILLEKDENQFPFDMYHVGEAVEAVKEVMLNHGFDVRYPGVVTEPDGSQYIAEWERSIKNEH